MERRIVGPMLIVTLSILGMGSPVGAQVAVTDTLEPELTDAGQEPRRLIRYEWVEGASETQTMRMEMRARATIDDAAVTDTTTTTEMTARYLVTQVFEDGSAQIGMVVEEHDLSVVDETAGATAAEVAGYDLDGLTGSWRVDTRGNVSEVSMDLPEGIAPEFAQQLEGTAVIVLPMPEEPVGVGASWQAAAPMDAGGVPAEILTTTEVLEMGEDSVLLGLTMSLDPEALASALVDGLPPEAGASVDRLEFDGDGRIEVRYDSFVPNTTATSDMSLELSFLAPRDGTTVPMTMVIESAMDLSQQRGE